MNKATATSICTVCKKSRVTYICQGCSEDFCFDHLFEHRINLIQEFDQLQNDHDQLRQDINDLKIDPSKSRLLDQINQWEVDSIEKIRQIAQQ